MPVDVSPALPDAGPVKCLVWDLDRTVWDGVLLEDSEVSLLDPIVATLEALDGRGILHSIASKSWDSGAGAMVVDGVLAKHVAATNAVQSAAKALQVLASAGAKDSGPVARAHRDAKLMEIIEGSSEICQLMLAQHSLTLVP